MPQRHRPRAATCLLSSDVSKLLDWVDSPSLRAAIAADDQEWYQSSVSIFDNLSFKISDLHSKHAVGLYLSSPIFAESQDTRHFGQGIMGLVADVNHSLRPVCLLEHLVASNHDRHEVGYRSTRDEYPACRGRETGLRGEPANKFCLHGTWSRACNVASSMSIER